MRLENKIAIVDGGGQGIGRQVAICMAREGASIVIADLNAETAGKTLEEDRKSVV